MSWFPQPISPLGYVRILAPTAGVRVSPVAAGAMHLGEKWKNLFGSGATREESFQFLDVYREAGGNFIDTANSYQSGDSEEVVGEWMEANKCRDEIVLATKYTYCFHPEASYKRGQLNWQGNSAKSLRLSVESSLKRLKTNYIDLLYVHMWDYTTSIPEVMHALDQLVKAGTVLYLGISDTPAWIVVKANAYAREKGLIPFSVYQGKWSLACRDLEVEIIPMLRSEGMALVAYGTNGSGKFKTAKEFEEREKAGNLRFGVGPTDAERAVSTALEEVAKELAGNPHPTSVAQAWAQSKFPYVFPLVGGASSAHLKSNIEASVIQLSPEQITKLESVKPLVLPFPYDLFGTDPTANGKGTQPSFGAQIPHIEFVQAPKALGPPGAVFKK